MLFGGCFRLLGEVLGGVVVGLRFFWWVWVFFILFIILVRFVLIGFILIKWDFIGLKELFVFV